MWDDLLGLAPPLFLTVNDGDRAGPPIDVGTALVLVGLAAMVGGDVARLGFQWPYGPSTVLFVIGVAATALGVRRAGR